MDNKMKEKIKIKIHSFIDVITNSSAELFVINKSFGLEFVNEAIKKEFPDSHLFGYLDNPEWDTYIDTEDAINHLLARGYSIVRPKEEIDPEAIIISCERGEMSDEFKKFIIETFNGEYESES
jgi:hypothetical protein